MSLSRAQNGPFATNKTFFEKKNNIIFILWLFSLCKIKHKKIQGRIIFGAKIDLFARWDNFFEKAINY